MKLPRYILVVDPGATMGWALFVDGKLQDSGHVSKKALFDWKLSAQAKRAGMKLPPIDLPPDTLLIGEMPTYRGGARGENVATPSDLIKLAWMLGEFVGLYRRKVGVVELVTPNDWKGNVPKDICHNRIASLLGADEILPENPNAKDASGIGLWKLGRYRR